MAARRLLIILVLLLAASVVAAALAPDRTSRLLPTSESSTTTTSTTTSTAPEPTGEAVTARIDASVKDPDTVQAFAGDQLALSVAVAAEQGRTISIEALGVTDFAAPEAPAHFDLLLRDEGDYPITDEDGTIVGRLRVRPPEAQGQAGDGRDT